ncbi:MAG TPA: hypothetical protein VLJ68_08750 [Chitinophagaceae bacterium]|nr:hypothetical protein [Chitinophagaceae bacterium]
MRLLGKLILLLIIPVSYCSAQRADSAMAPGSTLFKVSGSRSFWMGSNFRKEWLTPIKVPVINLATEHGGLKPEKRGGGKQTKSLHLVDANGRGYTFRSIQKFITSKSIPGNLQSEAAEDLIADGVSASYPYAALTMTVLSEAAGVPHMNPKIVMVPDDPQLGIYQQDFANLLVIYEAKLPDSVKKGYDTDEVADKLKDDNDNDVDQHALLRVRILDMFVMDLDRHEGQWTWGAYDNGKGKTFYPVAKDRDQAFYTRMGVLPSFASKPWLVPEIEGFKPQAKDIRRFNFAARNLDRFFLNQMTEDDWKKTTEDVLSRMTDAVIDRAFNQQPPEIRAISADKIAAKLKARRQYLMAEMIQYFQFLSNIVDITGSDKTELFDVTRNGDGSILVQVFKITKEGQQSTKMYERSFSPAWTKEVRLYGFGGNDRFVIHGSTDAKIRVRMIGGTGEDEFESQKGAGDKAVVYDLKNENNKIIGDKMRNKMKDDTLVNSYNRIYYKYNIFAPGLSFAYNSDDGLFLGLSFRVIRHGFRKTPYKNAQTFTVNHAVSAKSYNFKYNGEFNQVFGRKTDLLVNIDIKAPDYVTNFFGYGMQSMYNKTKPGGFKYYRARFNMTDITLMLRHTFSEKVNLTWGPAYEQFSLDPEKNTGRNIVLAPANGLDPVTLYEKQFYFGGNLGLEVDTRDNRNNPSKGIHWLTNLRVLSGLNDFSHNITQLNSELTFLLNLSPKTKSIVLANRTGVGHNFSEDYEFIHAQYLGGEDNLRGFRKFRFAGTTKVYNNTDLRIKLCNLKTYLLPAAFGMYAFFDTGRVSVPGGSSDWASGYGGGFWFAPFNRFVMTFGVGVSNENTLPVVGFGWKF